MYEESKSGASYLFENIDLTSLATGVGSTFAAEGYILESGSSTDGVYGRGSAAMHSMVGGLSKRCKFKVNVAQESDKVRLTINKAMSGAMGGLLGKKKVDREVKRICLRMKSPSSL